jgi:membrane associated rhomboid family serine protease
MPTPASITPAPPAGPVPWMNNLIILANVLAFIYQYFRPALLPGWQLGAHGLELSRFITYAFIHLGWLHLLVNMLMLHLLGNAVNQRLGQIGYLAFYLAGAVFSGIGFIIAGGSAVVGASGAVGAVMAAYLVLLPRANITLFVGFGFLEIPSMHFVIVFFLYNVIMSLASRLGVEQVAYEAHIAGMVFGFIIALALLLARLLPRSDSDLLSLLRAGAWRRAQ